MKTVLIALAASVAMSSVTASAAEFTRFEGPNSTFEGGGGEKRTVDGVDFWSNGEPPRRFQLLGYIEDKRHKTGLVGMVRMSGLESAIAKEAKDAGGDAVILVDSHAETTGYVSQGQTSANSSAYGGGNNVYASGHAWTNAQTAAVQKQLSRYAVVKYLPDEPEGESATVTEAGH